MKASSHKKVYEQIIEGIKESGGRVTAPRKVIVCSLLKNPAGQTISEIVQNCKLDEVSVYRNISFLLSLDLIEEVYLHDGSKKYAVSGKHHDHVVCKKCGLVVHIPCAHTAPRVVHHASFTRVDTHTLTYYGVCTKCSR